MDKIKINLSSLSYDKLCYDAETFDFTHADGSINLNAFINTVLVNMYDFRKSNVNVKRKFLQNKLSNKLSPSDIDSLASSLTSLDVLSRKIEKSNKASFISLRPSKDNEPVFDSIALSECQEASLSSFLLLLLEEYLHLDQSEREIIALRKEEQEISRAIDEQLIISYKDGNNKFLFMRPYTFGSNNENSFNYIYGLAGQESHYPTAIHLYKLKGILGVSNSHFSFDKEEKDILNKNLAEKGIQYSGSDFIKAQVELDKTGVKNLKKIYYNRPFIESLDLAADGSGKAVVSGSAYQIQSYFYRLQEHSFISYPVSLSRHICQDHERAYDTYKEKLKDYPSPESEEEK